MAPSLPARIERIKITCAAHRHLIRFDRGRHGGDGALSMRSLTSPALSATSSPAPRSRLWIILGNSASRVRRLYSTADAAVPEERERKRRTDWFYPGDLGSLTEDGVLCIMGRSGDVVNRGGTKLSSTEFESFLMACAGVKDAGICTHMGDAGYEEVWAAW